MSDLPGGATVGDYLCHGLLDFDALGATAFAFQVDKSSTAIVSAAHHFQGMADPPPKDFAASFAIEVEIGVFD